MKVFYEKFKKHYLLTSMIVLYAIIPIALAIVFNLNFHSLDYASQNIVTIISGVLSYIGTTALGLISVWQNRQSFFVNERLMKLQRSEFEKNQASILRFKEDIEFEKYKISDDFFEKCKAIPQSFFVMKNKEFSKEDKSEYLKVCLFFDSIGFELNTIEIEKLVLKTSKDTRTFIKYPIDCNTGYTFEFEKNAFKMSILLFDNDLLSKFKSLIESDTMLLELDLLLTSKANISSQTFISINLKNYKDTNKIKNCLYFHNKDSLEN